MDKVLITGITGHSGQYFLDELIAAFPKGVSIRALVRKTSDRAKLEKLIEMGRDVEIFEGNLADEKSLAAMTRGMDMVFHIAGVGSSLGLVRAALPNGVKRFVLVHTTGIYSKYKAAGEGYRRTEAEIRRLIAEENRKLAGSIDFDDKIEKRTNNNVNDNNLVTEKIDLTILRPTMIYGSLDDENMVKFIKMTDKLRFFPMVSGGHYALQPVHQQDLGRAYLQVLNMLLNRGIDESTKAIETNEPDTKQIPRSATPHDREYILSGGTVIDLIDIMKLISEYLGKKTTFFSVPFGIAYVGAWGVYLVSLGKVDYREKVQRLVEPRNYPHDEASRDFGYNPMPFAEGLRREVELYKKARG